MSNSFLELPVVMNNKVNSELSGISSVVSICNTTLPAYRESVIIFRDSLKSNKTIRMYIIQRCLWEAKDELGLGARTLGPDQV